MCIVSMVSDWQHEQWKIPKQFSEWKPTSDLKISLKDWLEYQDLKKKAEEYDKKTNQPECQEAWKKLVDEKIDEYIKQKFGDKD